MVLTLRCASGCSRVNGRGMTSRPACVLRRLMSMAVMPATLGFAVALAWFGPHRRHATASSRSGPFSHTMVVILLVLVSVFDVTTAFGPVGSAGERR